MNKCFYTIFASFIFFASQAFACDICALNTSLEAENIAVGKFHFGISEQYKRYGSLQTEGKHLENEGGQYMTSSISQIFSEYGYSDNFALQLSIPYINRRYKTAEGEEFKSGVVSGMGDLSLIAKYVPYRYQEGDLKVITQVFAGVKLPTGDSDLLKEEEHSHVDEDSEESHDEHGEEHAHSKHAGHHHGAVSAIHGHDLALGSGSVDIPFGGNLSVSWKRAIFTGDVEYLVRNKGDYGYEFADHLQWSTGAGYYLSLDDAHSVALKAVLSGEYKKRDHVYGELEDDTGMRIVYLGPNVSATLGELLKANLELGFPIERAATGTQAVADYRVRAGLTFVF